MLSQRTAFSLKGNNIHLPTRYKILKSQKGDKPSQSEPQQLLAQQLLPSTIPLKSLLINTTAATQKNQVKEPILQGDSFARKYQNRVKPFYSSNKTKRCVCGNCQQCFKDFNYFLHIFTNDQSVPQISAKSWCIWKKKNNKFTYYYGKRIHTLRQIASLTKMITAMTALDFLNKHSLLPELISYQIRKTSVMIGGTTAQLVEKQIYTLLDLLYGMMLPSGNDAAIAIAEIIGLLAYLKSKNKPVDAYSDEWYKVAKHNNYAYIFINMMNEKCQRIGTTYTQIFNSHGNDAYEQLRNVSTCNQIARISSQFMNYPLLRQIVKTVSYGKFQNTNKLLDDGFDGIKTGITDTAGPCLAASYKDLIIIVLNSKSMNERWVQVKKLVKWIIKKG